MSDMDHRRGWAPSGDVRIHYRAFGQKGRTPVLIVHGLSYFSYDWIDVASRLAAERAVVAIDQRGFGESDRSPNREYTLQTQAQDVIAVLDHLGWDKAVLMGHSMGGRICLCTAAWNPDRAAALVSVDFAPDLAPAGRRKVAEQIGRQPDLFESIDHALAYHGYDPGAASGALRRRFEAFLAPVGGGYALRRDLHYRDSFRHVLETGKPHPAGVDPWPLLANLDKPVLVIRAAGSELFAAETMDKVRAASPRAELIELAGGHDLASDNPEGLARCVRDFLARLDASGPSARALAASSS